MIHNNSHTAAEQTANSIATTQGAKQQLLPPADPQGLAVGLNICAEGFSGWGTFRSYPANIAGLIAAVKHVPLTITVFVNYGKNDGYRLENSPFDLRSRLARDVQCK